MSDLIRDLSSIRKAGGKRGAYRRVTENSSGVLTATEVNWLDIQYRIGSDWNNAATEEQVIGEALEIQATEEGPETPTLILKFSAYDMAFMLFMRDEVGPGKYFQIFLDWGKGSENKAFEVFFPKVSISRDHKSSFPGRKPEMTVNILDNIAAHTPSSIPTWAVGVAANFATGVGKKYQPFET